MTLHYLKKTALLCLLFYTHVDAQKAPAEPTLSTEKTNALPLKNAPKWDKDTQAVYDLLVAQMQSADANYSGSVDTLVKFAKSQKDEQLMIRAFRALLQTERYADAVDITELWRETSQNNAVDRFHVLALVLNNDIDKALATIEKSLDKASAEATDEVLLGYLEVLMSVWYKPEILKLVKKLYPDYSDSVPLGRAYIRLLYLNGETEQAVAILDKQLFHDPKNINLLQEKADIYRYALQLKDGENVWVNVLKDYPNEPLFQLAYAQYLYDRYDFERADKQLENIKDDKLAFSLATLKMMTKVQLKQYKIAGDAFVWDKLSDAEKDNAHYSYGDMLLSHQQYPLAQKQFEQVSENGELSPAAFTKIGETKYAESFAAGDAWFAKLEKKPQWNKADIARDKSNALQKTGHSQAALDVLNDFLKDNPQNDNARYARALIYAEMGRDDKAIEDLNHLHTAAPDDTDFQNALGYTLLSQPQSLERATTLIKKSLFNQPNSPAITDSMGWALFKQKKYSDALPFFRYAYSQYLDGEIIGHYVMTLSNNGEGYLAKNYMI